MTYIVPIPHAFNDAPDWLHTLSKNFKDITSFYQFLYENNVQMHYTKDFHISHFTFQSESHYYLFLLKIKS